jgi:hypothetical protein
MQSLLQRILCNGYTYILNIACLLARGLLYSGYIQPHLLHMPAFIVSRYHRKQSKLLGAYVCTVDAMRIDLLSCIHARQLLHV